MSIEASIGTYRLNSSAWVTASFPVNASPTKTVRSQSNHIYMSFVAYCKLEILKNLSCYKNQYQIKSLILIKANQASMEILKKLQNEAKSAA